MNLTAKLFRCSIALLMLCATASMAQPLRVSLSLTPHPAPYLSDWSTRKETAIVLITNTGTKTVDVKFDCKIYREGNLQANTKPESMKVLHVPPGASQYNGEDLVPFESVKIYGDADKTAIKTGMLPAGSYQFCVALLDPTTGTQITQPVCKSFTLTSYQAPILLQPADKSTTGKGKRPKFSWTAVSPKYPGPVHYRVVVFEVLAGQTPATAFRTNKPILDREDVNITQMQWPTDIELPRDAMQYVWGVIATDDRGNAVGEPGGTGGPNTFISCCLDSSPPDNPIKKDNTGSSGKDSGQVDTSGWTSDDEKNGIPLTHTQKLFNDTKPTQEDCPTLLSPADNAHLEKADDFVFRWENKGRTASVKRYFILQTTGKPEETIVRVDVSDKTQYKLDRSIAERLAKNGGTYRWTVQPEGGSPCAYMMITSGPCNPLLKITELTSTCLPGNIIRVCMKFYYSDSQGRPLKFTQPGSGIVAYQMPGYTPLLPSTNYTNLGNPITVSSLTIASGTTYQVCFDVGPTTAGQIDIGIQGDNLNANPNIICRPGVDSVIANPCICNKCDSNVIKIKLDDKKVKIDPTTGTLNITQSLYVGPDKLVGLVADIIYVHWEPEKEKCMPCDKSPLEWGVFRKAVFNGIDGAPTANEAHWTFNPGTAGTSGAFNFQIGLPPILDCCKLHGTVCIRYKFYLQSPNTPDECYECERVVCYSF